MDIIVIRMSQLIQMSLVVRLRCANQQKERSSVVPFPFADKCLSVTTPESVHLSARRGGWLNLRSTTYDRECVSAIHLAEQYSNKASLINSAPLSTSRREAGMAVSFELYHWLR